MSLVVFNKHVCLLTRWAEQLLQNNQPNFWGKKLNQFVLNACNASYSQYWIILTAMRKHTKLCLIPLRIRDPRHLQNHSRKTSFWWITRIQLMSLVQGQESPIQIIWRIQPAAGIRLSDLVQRHQVCEIWK